MEGTVKLKIFFYLILILTFSTPIQAKANVTRGVNVLASDPVSGKTAEVPLYDRTYAVLIGIDSYQEEGIPRLKNAVNDAEGIKQVLEKNYKFDEIISLYNKNATKERIIETLVDTLSDKVSKNDAVLVFWAGHGTQTSDTKYGEIGYLVPFDGSFKKFSKNISMIALKDEISQKLKAKHIFYIMDACYSGLMADTRALPKQTKRDLAALRKISKEDVRLILTAGRKGEEVLDGFNGHSVFTNRLIEALTDQVDFITANELQSIVTVSVTSDALKLNHNQTPVFKKLYGEGDFVFVPKVAPTYAPMKDQDRQNTLGATYPDNILYTETRAWDLIKESKNIDDFKQFIRNFPKGTFRDIALLRINELASSGDNAERPPDSVRVVFRNPKNATLYVNDKIYDINSEPAIFFKKGKTAFSLVFTEGNVTIYGVLEVKYINDDVNNATFGQDLTQQLFKENHIASALQGKPVVYGIKASTEDGPKEIFNYKLSLSRIR